MFQTLIEFLRNGLELKAFHKFIAADYDSAVSFHLRLKLRSEPPDKNAVHVDDRFHKRTD